MAEERPKEEERLKRPEDLAPNAPGDASKAQARAAVGSQSPGPGIRVKTPSHFNRSLGRSSRRSGHWAPGSEAARLSMGWGSTRRKGLKEALLPSGLGKTSQKEGGSGDAPGDQEEPGCEDLHLALDPLEHEWMLAVAQGDVESALRLLAKDPGLLSRRDFVTGFTVLHWLAKHGRHEDLIQVVAFAEQHRCPVDVDAFSASGRLTPLHLAALQGREMVIKVLVGAYGADTGLRDHNGRRAWQCLRPGAPRELKELLGASEEDLAAEAGGNANNNCAPSRRGGAAATNALKADSKGPGGGPQSQRAPPRFSYFRNMFKQAVAFFQEL